MERLEALEILRAALRRSWFSAVPHFLVHPSFNRCALQILRICSLIDTFALDIIEHSKNTHYQEELYWHENAEPAPKFSALKQMLLVLALPPQLAQSTLLSFYSSTYRAILNSDIGLSCWLVFYRIGEKVALSRRIDKHWRLIGWA